MTKRGQAWGFDLIIGTTIFLASLIFLYTYTINYPGQGEETYQILQKQADAVADSLLSKGSPKNWDQNSVTQIGLLTENRIDQSKLANFSEMVASDYKATRSKFRINNEFFVTIDEDTENGIGLQPTNPTNLVQVTRVVIYNQSITTLKVQIWN